MAFDQVVKDQDWEKRREQSKEIEEKIKVSLHYIWNETQTQTHTFISEGENKTAKIICGTVACTD